MSHSHLIHQFTPISGVPYELIEFLDPNNPLLVGGLGQNEEKLGVMKMRFKRHR